MEYRTQIDAVAHRQIVGWGLGDALFVEVHLRLNDQLPHSPTTYLRRDPTLFGGEGMTFPFQMIDPQNRMRVHRFWFQVFYGADEQTLFVTRGAHVASEGF